MNALYAWSSVVAGLASVFLMVAGVSWLLHPEKEQQRLVRLYDRFPWAEKIGLLGPWHRSKGYLTEVRILGFLCLVFGGFIVCLILQYLYSLVSHH